MVNRTFVPFEPVDPHRERIFRYFEEMGCRLDLRTMLARYWHPEVVVAPSILKR